MPDKNARPAIAGLLRFARDHGIEQPGAGADAMLAFDLDLVEAAAEPDHDARHAAVAHDEIGAGADRRHRNVHGQVAQEIREVVFILRHVEGLRRPADAEPSQFGQRLIGEQAPAQFRHARLQIGDDVGEARSSPAVTDYPLAAAPEVPIRWPDQRPDAGQIDRRACNSPGSA